MATMGLRAQMTEAARRRNAENSELARLRRENENLITRVKGQEQIIALQQQKLTAQTVQDQLEIPTWSASESYIPKPESTESRPEPCTRNLSETAGSALPPAWELGDLQSSELEASESEPVTSKSAQVSISGGLLNIENEQNSVLRKLLDDTRMALHYLACTQTISQVPNSSGNGNARVGSTVKSLNLNPLGAAPCESQREITTAEPTPKPSWRPSKERE